MDSVSAEDFIIRLDSEVSAFVRTRLALHVSLHEQIFRLSLADSPKTAFELPGMIDHLAMLAARVGMARRGAA